MRNISDKMFKENQKVHFIFNNFSRKAGAFHKIMWQKHGSDRQATDDNITRRMRFAC
jgi:hypothetical protein